MAVKQKVYELDNGATIIYQKQPKGTNTSAVIGFCGGSRLDGKYKGLSHLIEHLIFRGETENCTKKLIKNFENAELFTNAATSGYFIYHTLNCTDEKFEDAITTTINSIARRRIKPEEIKREIQVIKHEMDMINDIEYDPNAFELLMDSFKDDATKERAFKKTALIGNSKTLSMVTPEVINEYIKRYFNLNNFVISVSTSKPIEEVVEILNRTVFLKIKNAKSEKYILDLPEPAGFTTKNTLMVSPNVPSHNVDIDLVLRARNDYSDNPEKEAACNLVESICLNGNGFGGLLVEKFRVENPLVYNVSEEDINFGTALYKHFYISTNASKFRKAIKVLCDTIYDLGVNGYTKKQFERAKQKVLDMLKDDVKDKSGFAMKNFVRYVAGVPYNDPDLVQKYLKEITLDEFNSFVTSTYKDANVSMAVEGEFDARKMFRLVEIEQMLGKMSHNEELWDYNAPYVEHTEDPDPKIQNLTDSLQIIIGQAVQGNQKSKEEAVSMDDEVVR